MPIYEYHCQNCGERVEILLRAEGETPRCPNCGSLLLRKLFSAPYVMSKGREHPAGTTCCGREERCATPPCSTGEECRRR